MEERERQPYVHWTTCYDDRGDEEYRVVLLQQENVLQRYQERGERLSQQNRVIKFCIDVGFLTTVDACHLCTPSGTMIYCKQRERREWSSRSLNTPDTR